MFNHYIICLKKYAVFSGRATRSEYWSFILVDLIVFIVLCLLEFRLGLGLISQLYNLFVLIPAWAVFCRRMHDINRSGWNWLWGLLPIIGWIILLIYLCTPTKEGENKYEKA